MTASPVEHLRRCLQPEQAESLASAGQLPKAAPLARSRPRPRRGRRLAPEWPLIDRQRRRARRALARLPSPPGRRRPAHCARVPPMRHRRLPLARASPRLQAGRSTRGPATTRRPTRPRPARLRSHWARPRCAFVSGAARHPRREETPPAAATSSAPPGPQPSEPLTTERASHAVMGHLRGGRPPTKRLLARLPQQLLPALSLARNMRPARAGRPLTRGAGGAQLQRPRQQADCPGTAPRRG
mmetsp:Transcript_7853/g.31045  ORF Transcript_7853/g.31045 Transcript_7853/m.31045 type:complete len:242 (-) Transcript_7853:166-891(-)